MAGIIDDDVPPLLAEDEPLRARAAAVRELRERSRRLLVATPLGARGLDIPHCSHVYLFDVPGTADDYVHAAGRCGRMGLPGTVTVLGLTLTSQSRRLENEIESAHWPLFVHRTAPSLGFGTNR